MVGNWFYGWEPVLWFEIGSMVGNRIYGWKPVLRLETGSMIINRFKFIIFTLAK